MASGFDRSVTSRLSSRWQAGNHSAFWGMTLDEGIRYRLGTIRPSSSVMNMNEIYVSPFLPASLPFISQWHVGMMNLFLPCRGPNLQDEAVCPWASHRLLWWDCASKPSGACLLSHGKNAVGSRRAGSRPKGPAGHLGILGKKGQTALARKQQFSEKMPTQ